MSDQWPPPAPDMSGDFKKARDAGNDNALKPIVTKKQIQELEKQRKKPAIQLNMTPSGSNTDQAVEKQREARIKQMKTRLQKSQGKARTDFNRSKER